MGKRSNKLEPSNLNGDVFQPTKRQVLYILGGNINLESELGRFIRNTLWSSLNEEPDLKKESIEWLKVIIEESKGKILKDIPNGEIEKFLKDEDKKYGTEIFVKFKPEELKLTK